MPLLLVLLLVSSMDGGTPLFFQVRVGQNGRHFSLVKFRTMRIGTASLPTHMIDANSFTRLGGFLRRSKLDELPQLWNVLKGDMSLVGPRPSLPTQTEVIASRELYGVGAVRPGVTGLAQLRGVDMSDPRSLAELDAKMMRELTVGRYLVFLFKTAAGRGAGDRVGRATDDLPRGP
jgi:lipopolysaccharide/colanic/teichoic acid biosynthesis glycosyltransferase